MQDLVTGHIIKEKYSIVQKHGEGTLGTVVYLGHDIEKDIPVIIRILSPNLRMDDEMNSRFTQGTVLAKKLNHPNILVVLDAGEEDGLKFLVTSYEKGFFLNDYLEHRGHLDEKESLKLIKALAEALRYAWDELKIIHRNICPDTILIAKGNVPMLTDFDLAKSLDADNNLTLEGLAIGSPMYMSPEQAKGAKVDFHSDIYCLGLIFYQLLSGKPPFCYKSKMDILRAQVNESHAQIQSVNKDITDACSTILDKMLAKNIADRYQSWDAAINDIDAILNDKPPSNLQAVKAVTSLESSRYKMQAITMDAVKPPEVQQQKVRDSIEEQPTSPSALKPHTKNKTKVFLLCVLMLFVVALILWFFPSNKEETSHIKMTHVTEKQVQVDKDKQLCINVDKDRKLCINNIKQLALALQMYANVFDKKFPQPNGAKGLDLLRSGGFLELPQVYVSPLTGHSSAAPGKPITEATCDYVYVGGLSEYSDPKTPVLWTKPNQGQDYGIILYVNGDVKIFEGNDWLRNTKIKK